MTAANLFVTQSAAFLLSDTAILASEHDNRARDFRSKIASDPRLRFAAALTGNSNVAWADDGRVMSPLGSVCSVLAAANDEDEALHALPAALEGAFRDLSVMTDGAGSFRIVIAAWIPGADEPRGYVICSPNALLPGAKAFQPLRMLNFVSPNAKLSLEPESIERSATALAQEQRGYRWEGNSCRVGGRAELTTVNVSGVQTITVCDWPEDRVGELLDRPMPGWKRAWRRSWKISP